MIPQEIVNFIKSDGRKAVIVRGDKGGKRIIVNLGAPAKSLLIKGDPGSGKTTFSLELLNYFRDEMAIFYLSSRVPDHVLIQQFPWISQMLHLKVEKKERKIKRDNLRKLEGFIEDGTEQKNVSADENEITFEVGAMLPELEKVYDFIESQKDKMPLICIDSLDGLAEKYGVPAEKIMMALQKDVVENHLGNIIFVTEKASLTTLDYLADGIVLLKHDPSEGFWKRIMYILKLRGSSILKPKYAYTLHDGHFSVLTYQKFSLDHVNSLAIEEIEKEIKKYANYFTINIRVSPNVPVEVIHTVFLAAIKSSENSLVLPPAYYPGENIKQHASRFFKKSVKIFGHGNERGDIYLEGKDISVEMSPDVLKYYGGEKSTMIISTEAINNIYGDIRYLMELTGATKSTHRIFFLSPDKFELTADKEIRITMVEDIPVLISDKAYAIQPEIRDDNLRLNLVPLA